MYINDRSKNSSNTESGSENVIEILARVPEGGG